MSESNRYWGVVPAAGVGRRMGTVRPKQYLEILGKSVIEWTLDRLLGSDRLSGVVVALGREDPFWPSLPHAHHPRIRVAEGGKQRADSVHSALVALSAFASEQDWVLVHDAARLCITVADIEHLIDQVRSHPVGGILALPSSDTLKRVEQGEILVTVDRSQIWRALTPQMFRLGALRDALTDAAQRGLTVTDEASAMELQGLRPLIVEGRPDNIKITRPEDLPLAAFFLERQCSE